MAESLMLRIKTKHGIETISSLTGASTIAELRSEVSALTNLSVESVKLLRGFPPKPLEGLDSATTLAELHLKSGETLIAEEDMSARKVQLEKNYRDEMSKQCEHGAGILTRRIVPADNSCLFTSVDFVLNDGARVDTDAMQSLRCIIADAVADDPVTYNEAFLGQPNDDYCIWIKDESSWGGAIELSILSRHYHVEIDVIDTQSGRIDRFGQSENYNTRVLLIYDGVHYDPLVMESADGATVSTVFPTSDDAVLSQAIEIGAEAKSCRQFTDVRNFTLRCLICQTMLRGEKEAMEHGSRTGHANFGEV